MLLLKNMKKTKLGGKREGTKEEGEKGEEGARAGKRDETVLLVIYVLYLSRQNFFGGRK